MKNRLLSLIIVVIFLGVGQISLAETIFEDNFDSGLQWSGSADITIKPNGNTGSCLGDQTNGDDSVQRNITPITFDANSGAQMTFFMKKSSTAQMGFPEVYFLVLADNVPIMDISFGKTGADIISLNRETVVATGLAAAIFHKVDAEWNFSLKIYRARVNNGAWSNWVNFYGNSTAVSFNGLAVMISNSSTYGGFVDDIIIFRASSPEPEPTNCPQGIIISFENTGACDLSEFGTAYRVKLMLVDGRPQVVLTSIDLEGNETCEKTVLFFTDLPDTIWSEGGDVSVDYSEDGKKIFVVTIYDSQGNIHSQAKNEDGNLIQNYPIILIN